MTSISQKTLLKALPNNLQPPPPPSAMRAQVPRWDNAEASAKARLGVRCLSLTSKSPLSRQPTHGCHHGGPHEMRGFLLSWGFEGSWNQGDSSGCIWHLRVPSCLRRGMLKTQKRWLTQTSPTFGYVWKLWSRAYIFIRWSRRSFAAPVKLVESGSATLGEARLLYLRFMHAGLTAQNYPMPIAK